VESAGLGGGGQETVGTREVGICGGAILSPTPSAWQ